MWKVVLPTPADVWHVNMNGAQLIHVSTGKMLTVTNNRYPDLGDNMTEVVTKDPNHSGHDLWSADYIRYPKYCK